MLKSSVLPHLDEGFSLPSAFLGLFQNLSHRGVKTVLEVVLVCYGSASFMETSQEQFRELVILVGRTARGNCSAEKDCLTKYCCQSRQALVTTRFSFEIDYIGT